MNLTKQKPAEHATSLTAYFPYDEQRINYVTHISDRHRVVYVETPKAGCTTIKRALQIIEAGGEAGLGRNVHDRDISPLKTPQTSCMSPEEIYTSPDLFRFCFVRNPYTRVVSAYLDKFVINKWEARRRLPKLGFAPDAEISLLQFLRTIAARRPERMDIHWMPQTVLLQPHKVHYGVIGRLENFDADFTAIMQRIAPSFLDSYGAFNRSPHRTGAAQRVAELVGPEEEALIRQIYADDFAVFGYDPAPPVDEASTSRTGRPAAEPKKRLILHIGTHATGTTSIQRWFAVNSAGLARQGVFYPDLNAGANNPAQHFIATAAERRSDAPARSKRLTALIQRLRTAPGHVAMVSSELLSLVDPAPVAELFAEFDCEVLCILRRQDEFLEGLYRELVKNSVYGGDKDDFLEAVLAGEPITVFTNNANLTLKGIVPLDYAAMLERWAASFGPGKVHALAHDDEASGGDALAKAQRLIGIAEEPPASDHQEASLGARLVLARRMLDRHLDWQAKVALRPAFWKVNGVLGMNDKTVIFGDTDRRRIMAAATRSNRRLAETYLKGVAVDWLAETPAIAPQAVAGPLTPEDLAEICAAVMAAQRPPSPAKRKGDD